MITDVALCHLPEHEISWLYNEVKRGCTTIYQNDAGFMVWRGNQLRGDCPLTLAYILNLHNVYYVRFDVHVEPDPELEIFE